MQCLFTLGMGHPDEKNVRPHRAIRILQFLDHTGHIVAFLRRISFLLPAYSMSEGYVAMCSKVGHTT